MVIYLLTTPYFDGFRDALGTTAALCFLPAFGIKLLLKQK